MLNNYIFVIYKMGFLSLATTLVIPKIFVSILFIILFVVINNNFKNNTKIKLNDLKIDSWLYTIVKTVSLIIILMLPFYLRILRVGNTLDIKFLLLQAKAFMFNNSWCTISVTIIFYIIIIFTVIYYILLLRKILFYHFLSLHIYLMNYFSTEDFFEISIYQQICNKLINIDCYIPDSLLDFITYIIAKVYYKMDLSNSFNQEYISFNISFASKINYYVYKQYISLYLSLICILYDIFFNNMILVKIFYILPIIFVFYIFQKISIIVCFFEKADCLNLYELFTKNVINIQEDFIIFEDNTSIEKGVLAELNIKFENAFKVNNYTDYYEESFWLIKERKMAPLFCFMLNIYCISYLLIYCNIYITFITLGFNLKLEYLALLLLFIQNFYWIYPYKRVKYLFWLANIIILVTTILIYCNHTLLYTFYETLYSNSYFIINDFHTLKHKIYFLENYLALTIDSCNLLNIDQKKELYTILKNINYKEYISDSTTILQIKHFIDSIPSIYLRIELNYTTMFSYDQALKPSIIEIIIKKLNLLWKSVHIIK